MRRNKLIGLNLPPNKKLKKPIITPHPLSEERAYQKDLRYVVQLMSHAIDQLLIPQLPQLVGDANKFKDKVYTDDATGDTNRIFKRVRVYLNNNIDAENMARKHAAAVNTFNSKWFFKQMTHVFGINIFSSDAWLKDHLNQWTTANVGLITSLQDKALQEVHYQVQSGFMKGLRPESISKNIKERLNVADSRANLIGRDQVSKLNGQLNQLRQTDVGVDSYRWHTAGDERVRPSHAEKEGNIYRWDDPPADTGHPGEDYQCRCIAIPIFDASLYATTEW